MFSDIHFAYQPFLFLLAALPLFAIWYFMTFRERSSDILFSHSAYLDGVRQSIRMRVKHLPVVLRLLAISLLIIVLARPQSTSSTREVSIEGLDIMIALDISGSMLAEDFQPNRMEAAKETAMDFIDLRGNDRIGMTIFSGQSFTLCPLTTDHALLKELTAGVTTGMVEDGTAIGDGLATAINRLRDSDATSRVIILLTDGINNTGVIDPLTAADMAALFDIRVYTIGIGSSGPVPYPFQTPLGVRYQDVEIPVDEELLQEIANITGGQYYWADTPDALEKIYEEIDKMETTIIDHTEFILVSDEYMPFLLLAMIFIALETILKYTWLRTIP